MFDHVGELAIAPSGTHVCPDTPNLKCFLACFRRGMDPSNRFKHAYERSHYRLVGKHKHSALKPCHWMLAKLFTGRENRNCYKGYFGIQSEKCIQCTPALPFCTHACVFCWRDIEEGALGPEFNLPSDEPGDLVREFIRHQRNMIEHHVGSDSFETNYHLMYELLETGLNGENCINIPEFSSSRSHSATRVERAIVLLKTLGVVHFKDGKHYPLDPAKTGSADPAEILATHVTTPREIRAALESARSPSHAAISLAGEPTLYPRLASLVHEFKRRAFTTFIVTNGTTPDVLASMDTLPTQVYLTLPHPDEAIYKKIHRPCIPRAYEKITRGLELLGSLGCRTCLRITMVKGVNDVRNVDGYVRMVRLANPHFLEIKGFAAEARAMLVKKRMGLGGKGERIGETAAYAPSFQDVLDYARRISERTGWPIVERSKPSRDVLMLVNWPRHKSIKIERA